MSSSFSLFEVSQTINNGTTTTTYGIGFDVFIMMFLCLVMYVSASLIPTFLRLVMDRFYPKKTILDNIADFLVKSGYTTAFQILMDSYLLYKQTCSNQNQNHTANVFTTDDLNKNIQEILRSTPKNDTVESTNDTVESTNDTVESTNDLNNIIEFIFPPSKNGWVIERIPKIDTVESTNDTVESTNDTVESTNDTVESNIVTTDSNEKNNNDWLSKYL